MSSYTLNPNIAATLDTQRDENCKIDCARKVYVRNIGNAARDEQHCPLGSRLAYLLDDIKNEKPDVVILLEAGRSSNGMNWTEIADTIERDTGLFYGGIKRINATRMSFGKAFFYNPDTVAVGDFNQHWTGDGVWSGDYFGNDIVTLKIYPVALSKVLVDAPFTVAAVHFPMKLDARLKTSQWLVEHFHLFDAVAGDFNTFEDDGGPEMLEIIKHDAHLVSLLPPHVITFKAFLHDLVDVPNEKLAGLNPSCVVVENGPTTSKVLFSSHLDHCFLNTLAMPEKEIKFSARVSEITRASDHAAIIITAKYL